jgi:ComF family protein
LNGVVIVAHYNDAAKRYLHEIKYNLYYALVAELQQPLVQALQKSGIEVDVAVPVPLHRSKLWWRGFNQAELLARLLDILVVNLLKRGRNTRTQVGLDRQERLQNLRDAFYPDKNKADSAYASVLLVDDVMTTGTTLEECAQVLRAQGVEQVFALTFARGD